MRDKNNVNEDIKEAVAEIAFENGIPEGVLEMSNCVLTKQKDLLRTIDYKKGIRDIVSN